MKLLQSSIERILYLNLLLVFLLAIGSFIAFTSQQRTLHNQSTVVLRQIEQNQVAQTKAVKIYIDCLLKLNPHGNIPAQEQACFNKAPEIMQ